MGEAALKAKILSRIQWVGWERRANGQGNRTNPEKAQ
jgi:hypothetical protein